MQSEMSRAKLGLVATALAWSLAVAIACSNSESATEGGAGQSSVAMTTGGSAGSPSGAGATSSPVGSGGSSTNAGGAPTTPPAGSGGVAAGSSGTAAGASLGGFGGASGGAEAGAGGAGGAGMAAWCLPLSAHPMGTDWAKALIDSQIKAKVSLTWQYPDGLFLHGVYLAYKRLNDPTYLSLMKQWADANVNGKSAYGSLDDMQPTLVLDDMYRETKDAKYLKAPSAAAARLTTTYPKTSDGGFWHKTDTNNQLWGDGVFMDLPPLVNYGDIAGDASMLDVATQQLVIYDSHIAASNNLHVHQWDGSSGASGKQSCCEWCRAEGWYEMAILMVLDFTPTSHKDYAALVAIVQRLAKGLAATQDSATGRWWQVMDKPGDGTNWLETSCTAMHTYFLSKASQKGYVDAATYAPLAIKGFNGELQMVSNASNVQIKNICPGTGVLGSPAEYYARPPQTNDNHGLGAFLLMYDQLTCR
jgi:unsaturated rhamnogalacturonyl hydrolase